MFRLLTGLATISGIPQESMVGLIHLNIFFNAFFYFILITSAHNYDNDNILVNFGKTLKNLTATLSHHSSVSEL